MNEIIDHLNFFKPDMNFGILEESKEFPKALVLLKAKSIASIGKGCQYGVSLKILPYSL